MDLLDVTLVPKDDSMTEKVAGTQPRSSKAEMSEANSHVCSRCKLDFKTEDDYDVHVDEQHEKLQQDDKEALKTTSELTAALDLVFKENPDIFEAEEIGTKEEITPNKEQEKLIENSDINDHEKKKDVTTKEPTENSQQTKQVKNVLVCHKCDFTAFTERDFRMHDRTSHELLLSCKQCLVKTKTKEELKIHMQDKHYMKIKCEKCEFKSKDVNILKMHTIKKHMKLDMFPCDECERKFQSRMLLVLHKKKHISAFKCDHCSYKGISVKSLQVHKLKNHIQNSFSTIGMKRDHNMVPKNTASTGDSPPRKFKKIEVKPNPKPSAKPKAQLPTSTKDVVGGAGWGYEANKENTTKHIEEINTTETCKTCGFRSKNKTELHNHHEQVHGSQIPKDLQQKGLEELPENVKALGAYEDCLRQLVIGNGACGPNCAATHLWLDSRKGPEFSRDLNTHIGIHSEEYIQHITFPRTVILGNGLKNEYFGDSKEEKNRFIDYLVADPTAVFMFREGVDMQAMSNMSNMDIDIVKVDSQGNVEPLIHKYTPNPDFEWKDKERPTMAKEKMTLINQNNHFDLIVKKNSVLAQDGTLEYQARGQANKSQQNTLPNEIPQKEISPETEAEKVIKLLNKEIDKLKTENRVLKQKIQDTNDKFPCEECGQTFNLKTVLEEHMKQHIQSDLADRPWLKAKRNKQTSLSVDSSNRQHQTKTQTVRFSELWHCDQCDNVVSTRPLLEAHKKHKHNQHDDLSYNNCSKCDHVFDTKKDLEEHMNSKHVEETHFLCDDCDFQATTGLILKKHMLQAHHKPSELVLNDLGSFLKCRDCENEFTSKPDLMDHRRDIHTDSRRKCKYKREDNCRYPDSVCWYSHNTQHKTPETNNEGGFKCHTCENRYSSKSQLMSHRKIHHPETLPWCKDGDRCTFGKEECRFRHEEHQGQKEPVPEVWKRNYVNESLNGTYSQSSHLNSNFWPAPGGQKPPDQLTDIMQEMKTLMLEMNQIKNQIKTQIRTQ